MRLLLVAFSTLLTIALVELVVIFTPLDFRPLFGTLDDVPWKNPVNRLDPELLHVRRANLKLEGKIIGGDISQYRSGIEKQSYEYNVTYDQNGFRNPSNRSHADIVVVGDSFVEAPTIPDAALATTILSNSVSQSVQNLGQSWYGPQQMHIALKRFGENLSPKEVVWVFYGGNDLFDFRRYENILPQWQEISPGLNNFFERSLFRNLIRLAKKKLRAPAQLPAAVTGECNAGASGKTKLAFFYPDTPLSSEDLQTLPKVAVEINSAVEETRKIGARFTLVYAPTKFQVYRDSCDFNPANIKAEWSGSGLANQMAKIAASSHVNFLDLTADLSLAATTKGAVYFSDDTHWNSLGQKIAGESIAKALSASNVQP